jgi:Flp pilus assembly protein TadB
MLTDFAIEYSRRSDGELLHLASARHSLVPEAAAALDSELRRRNLSKSSRIEHQKSVKRQERREGRRQTNLRRRWERLGLKWQLNWREILELLAVMTAVLVAYFALPSRYHLNPD